MLDGGRESGGVKEGVVWFSFVSFKSIIRFSMRNLPMFSQVWQTILMFCACTSSTRLPRTRSQDILSKINTSFVFL